MARDDTSITIPIELGARLDRAGLRMKTSRRRVAEFLISRLEGMLEDAVPKDQVTLSSYLLKRTREPMGPDTLQFNVNRHQVDALRPYARTLEMGLSRMISCGLDLMVDLQGRITNYTPDRDGIEGDIERMITLRERSPLEPPTGDDNE